ncbi:MAG: hypothetical protein ACPGXZ_06405, partial [Saprospiraceae bacterium]
MNNSFSPSINIIRDVDKPLYYLPTNNSKQIFKAIATNFDSGLHSFTIIGSYGTGKSAFLLALEKTLTQQQVFFEGISGQFKNCQNFDFINIVGAYRSIIEVVGEEIGVEADTKTILKAIKKRLSDDKCLVISIDEFGKLLEFAAKNNPDKELYFIQLLAELANDRNRNLLFISTLHQNFDAYALDLAESQRKEWEKVKGRLKELTFNEPVEQLLALAANRIDEKYKESEKPTFPKELLQTIESNSIFPLRNELSAEFVQKLYPFEPLSAAALTIALQKYGQNERSLFTFLDTKEYLGLEQYDQSINPYYNLSCVYDYLHHNYYSTLTSRYNPDYFRWNLIRDTLERVDANFDENIDEVRQLVKTIGLLNALGSKAAKVNLAFLQQYAKACLSIDNLDLLLGQLQGQKLIRYKNYLDSYHLYEGSDIDIEAELDDLRKTENNITNLSYELKKFLPLEYAPAKAVSYQVGTPRFFSFEYSEKPMRSFDSEEIDGFVNLIFSTADYTKEITEVEDEPILYAVFEEAQNIETQLFEIKVISKLFEKIDGKDAAKRELQNLKDFRTQQLRVYLLKNLFEGSEQVQWYFNGKNVTISSRTAFNKFLSVICETIYHQTPVLRNELMNRHKLSGNISTARRKFIERLITHSTKEDLGFTANEFPPEKAVYYAMLKNTGIHRGGGHLGSYYFAEPLDDSLFQSIWDASNEFLESATVGRKYISDFVQKLSKKPIKLKNGFIEYWIPTFLFIKREDFALFHEGAYIPFLNNEILEVLLKDSSRYSIKTFAIEGIKLELFNKYRQLIQQEEKDKVQHSTFLGTVKPFIRFYSQQPKYAKLTDRLSNDAKAFRSAIETAKELEKVFFEDLPTNFGLSLSNLVSSEEALSDYIKRLRTGMRELSSAYPDLIIRVEEHLLEELGLKGKQFHQYKKVIDKRYKSLKNYLLTPQQKVIKARFVSPLEDREKYLNSISSALIGKSLEQLSDNDEPLLHKKLLQAVRELDSLLEMTKLDID